MIYQEVWGKGEAQILLERTRLTPGNYELTIKANRRNNASKAAAKLVSQTAQNLRAMGVSERNLINVLGKVFESSNGWLLMRG